jgi:hypothetical protein
MRLIALFAGALVSFALPACADHDPEIGHVGGGSGGTGAFGGTSGAAGSGGAACTPDPTIADPVLPCEIDAILEAKCRRCHSEPQQNSAPFPLLTWEDTQAEYSGKLIYVRMHNAVNTDFMPLTALQLDPPVEKLTAAEKDTLLAWLVCAEPADGVVCP